MYRGLLSATSYEMDVVSVQNLSSEQEKPWDLETNGPKHLLQNNSACRMQVVECVKQSCPGADGVRECTGLSLACHF